MLKGIDISYAQGTTPDLSPYDFVIVRSNDGTDKDSKLEQHANAVLKAGKLLGFYLYSYPNLNTAKAEAQAMLEYVKPYLGQCILALDWEGTAVSGNYPASYCLEFLNYIKETTGITPFFYTFGGELRSGGDKYKEVAANFPLWVAHWDTDTPAIGVWDKWTIWQYTDKLNGQNLDGDYFDGTAQDWQDYCGEIAPGEWIAKNERLNDAEMQNNALLVWRYFRDKGWSLEAVSAMLGNMEMESTINPGAWGDWTEGGDPTYKGYGLVQWTPYTRIQNWLKSHGYEMDSGEGQCAKIQTELTNPGDEVGYPPWTQRNGYNISFEEFSVSTENVAWLALAFCSNYENPADPDQPIRGQLAQKWYAYLLGGNVFVPRLDSEGMEGNPYWYADNPFYQSGFGLPNCTCYVWGRWWEITGERPTGLSTGDARTFWYRNESGETGPVPSGQTPRLGAIMVFDYPGHEDEGGHVAVVEQINADGSIVTSNSAWGGRYFYTQTLYPPDYSPVRPGYEVILLGYLYLDSQPIDPGPPPEPPAYLKTQDFPLFMMLRHPF